MPDNDESFMGGWSTNLKFIFQMGAFGLLAVVILLTGSFLTGEIRANRDENRVTRAEFHAMLVEMEDRAVKDRESLYTLIKYLIGMRKAEQQVGG